MFIATQAFLMVLDHFPIPQNIQMTFTIKVIQRKITKGTFDFLMNHNEATER